MGNIRSRDIERLLLRIEELGRREGRFPLGENWPFGWRPFEWERAKTWMALGATWPICLQ
jgi:hypothetical protein